MRCKSGIWGPSDADAAKNFTDRILWERMHGLLGLLRGEESGWITHAQNLRGLLFYENAIDNIILTGAICITRASLP